VEQPAQIQQRDIREYPAVLWRRKWTILLVTALTVGSTLAFSLQQTPLYTSTAGVLVKPPTTSITTIFPGTTLVSMDTEKRIAGSTAVAQLAARALPGTTVEQVLQSVDVSFGTNELVLEISYSDPNPHAAQKGAGAVADAYLTFKTRQAVAALARARQALQEQIAQTQTKLDAALAAQTAASPGSPERTSAAADVQALTTQKAGFEATLGTVATSTVDPGDVIEKARLPTAPSSPRILVNTALGVFVGLALGVGLAFLRERLDDRIHRREALEDAAGAPVLSVIPKVQGWRKKSWAELPAAKAPKGAAAEAYRTIRTNLLFMAKDGLKTIAVTSPGAGEGKTTTAANLAVSLAQAERRVIVVSADLRKPRLHQFFNLHSDVGLANLLARQATIFDAIQRPAIDRLRVIASGPVPPNPAELLTANDMDVLLDQLRSVADFVIVDTPPVLAVSDVLVLAPKVDGVLIVADAETTHRGAVAHLRDQLEQVGGSVVGAVLNNFDPARARYYPYYRYTYTYRYREEGAREVRPHTDARPNLPLDNIWRTDEPRGED
jgi:succinoglycan biosynthesis transport protein ExoP